MQAVRRGIKPDIAPDRPGLHGGVQRLHVGALEYEAACFGLPEEFALGHDLFRAVMGLAGRVSPARTSL
ncbi:hypothetical protein SXCC_03045 [Gluconacetobacter sp. SXCC-1]|nr:hypothetical protein SXCC_03045 [Gluconacetobacter sp. SXCC-1]